MNIFISWSGDLSKNVAILLNDFLKKVIQATKPFVSSDIPKGAQWFNELMGRLNDSSFGIVCLTPDNINRPWLLFEAGAIAKTFDNIESHVSTLLIGDLSNSDLSPPLSNFQSTIFNDKDDMLKLLITINNLLETGKLEQKDLEETFNTWWEAYKELFDNVLSSKPDLPEPRKKTDRELLEEILDLSRQNTKDNLTTIGHLISIFTKLEGQDLITRKSLSAIGRGIRHGLGIQLPDGQFGIGLKTGTLPPTTEPPEGDIPEED